jgi:GH24 family phage-related lysozyme (muramidase)
MAVAYRDASGTEQKFALPVTSPDRPTIVDARWVQPGGLLHGAVEVLSTDEASGTASVKVDFPEEGNDSQSIVLDERSELRFNPRNSTWELRYIDRGEGVQKGFMDTVRGALEAIGLTTPREEVTRTLQGLTEDQRKAWSRAVANKDPRFWSDEQLRRRGMAKATDEVAAEVRRRQEGGKRMTIDEVTSVRPGMGVKAQDGDTFTPTASETMEREAQAQEVLDKGIREGTFTSRATKRADREETTGDKLMGATLGSMSEGSFLDDLSQPNGQKFMTQFAEFIEDVEGYESYAYDDNEGGVGWSQSTKTGAPTIGFGLNLQRPDIDDILKAVGAPKKKDLLANKEIMTREQATAALGIVAQKNATWLKKHFEGVPMERHRWLALMSLAYNSRWGVNGPTLVGPKLTKAIKEGRWEDAAYEIEFNSSGGVTARQKAGILARRRYEASMFRGASDDLAG